MNSYNQYVQSFGFLADQTLYSSMSMKSLASGVAAYDYDLRKDMFGENNSRLAEVKSLSTTTGGAGTAGYALIPVYVDSMIIDQSRKNTPLCEIIPRRSNMGLTADYNVITAKGGAFVAAEGASLAETNDTYNRASKSIKYLYAVGKVTGPARAAVPPYVLSGFQPEGGQAVGSFSNQSAPNAIQMEILVKSRSLKELEENLIINGNSETAPNEFDGFVVQMSSTNQINKSTVAVSLEDYNTAVQTAFDKGGRPNLAVCSSSVYTDTLNLLQQRIGYMQAQQQVLWGFQSIVLNTLVGEVVMIPSMFMSNVSGSKVIYFLDLSVIEMRVLQDMTYEELAKVNDEQKFMLKMYECLIVRAPSFCASIIGIK